MALILNNLYEIEQEVYLKTDPAQLKRLVSNIIVLPGDRLKYTISCGAYSSEHHEFEISDKMDYAVKESNM